MAFYGIEMKHILCRCLVDRFAQHKVNVYQRQDNLTKSETEIRVNIRFQDNEKIGQLIQIVTHCGTI